MRNAAVITWKPIVAQALETRQTSWWIKLGWKIHIIVLKILEEATILLQVIPRSFRGYYLSLEFRMNAVIIPCNICVTILFSSCSHAVPVCMYGRTGGTMTSLENLIDNCRFIPMRLSFRCVCVCFHFTQLLEFVISNLTDPGRGSCYLF